jgi:BMFP domain-containing protein YqiC
MALVPKHEFEAQEALLQTLEAQVKNLETRLLQLEESSAHGSPPDARAAED